MLDANHKLLYNARIWQSGVTDEPDRTWIVFNTVTGYVTSTGVDDPPLHRVPNDQRTNCAGRRILPGLHESHIHVSALGQLLNSVDLAECRSIEEFQERVRTFIDRHPGSKWIIGQGWEQDLLGRFPSKHDLDVVSKDKPIFLKRKCTHIAVANSIALELAGISYESVDPPGGSIGRCHDDHTTTGLLFENTLDILNALAEPSEEEWMKYVDEALNLIVRHGVTSVHSCEPFITWPAFCRLADENRLPVRVFYSAYYNRNNRLPAPREQYSSMLTFDRVKLFADGALGVETAAMSQPYLNPHTDGRCNHGMLLLSQKEMTNRVHSLTSNGYRFEIHVIGDEAADVALTAIETVNVSPEKRPILIHCQILRGDLIRRMKSRGVIASIQPQFLHTDCRWLSNLLSPDLLRHAYAWKTLLDEGIVCAGGSDAPVEKPEPLIGIYDAIFRRVDRRPSGEQFKPEECLTVRQAIDLYTVAGAYTAMHEDRLGKLLPGYQADFIVLDDDVCARPEDLLNTNVVEVWVAGQRKI